MLPYSGKEGCYQGQISGELLELVNEVASSVFHDCMSVFNLGYLLAGIEGSEVPWVLKEMNKLPIVS